MAFLQLRPARPRMLAGMAVLCTLWVLGACSPHVKLYPELEKLTAGGKYAEGLALVEKSVEEYGETNEVLYHLDRGVLLQLAGKYTESNQAFASAEQRMEELYTESITGNVAAFALNDNTLPYRGADYELVMVNIFQALNYTLLGQIDEALVEARKVDVKLNEMNSHYEEGQKNVYNEDAFARLLMGIFYEVGGSRDDLNDAYISNKLATGIYRKNFTANYNVDAPALLGSNLLATAAFMGPQETEEAKQLYPGHPSVSLNAKRELGQVVFIHMAGKSPVKVEKAVRIPTTDGNRIKVAYPEYTTRGYHITGSRVVVQGGAGTTLEVGEPVGAIAKENLKNQWGRIQAKAIARATSKYAANRALQREARERKGAAALLGFVAGNVYAEVSEQADLRAWQTLPNTILIGRTLLPPGTHRLSVEFTGNGGNTLDRKDLGEITINGGETRFFLYRSIR